jgi:PhnB protein
MASVSTYLNFPDYTEKAFLFYKKVFGTEFTPPGIRRMGDMPPMEGMPPTPDHLKNLVMHVELPITGGHILMGTDAPAQMGFHITFGNNIHIQLQPDTKEETQKLFNGLSEGGVVDMELQDMFWGAYFGSLTDQFGVKWMFNCIKQ